LFLQRAFDARLDEPVQHLDDDAALLLVGDRSDRLAAEGRRELLKRKNRHGVSPVVELRHSWNFPLQRHVNGLHHKPFRPI
jgi:hypothetical protein